MDTKNSAVSDDRPDGKTYLMKVNGTAVVIRFSGSDSIETRLARAFGSTSGSQYFPLEPRAGLW